MIIPSMSTVVIFTLLCFVYLVHGADKASQVYGTAGKVILKPPKLLPHNSTLFVSKTSILIQWMPPDVYPLHKVNKTFMDENNPYLNNTEDTIETTVNPDVSDATSESPREETSATTQKTDGSTSKSINFTKVTLSRPKCMSESQFKQVDSMEVLVKSIGTVVGFIADASSTGNSSQDLNSTVIKVDFDTGCVEKYIVNWVKNGSDDSDDIMSHELDGDLNEFNITDLTEGTTYTIFISAVFTSKHVLNSNNLSVTTKTTEKIECHCSFFGKQDNTTCTTSSFPWCKCKPQYTGAFCEICRPGFYRSAPYFPCNRCPCSPLATTSPTCDYREGYLVCNKCKRHYTGHLCQSCTNGYYRYHGRCVPCFCNFNSDPAAPRKCDPYTGACTKCINNTTGIRCQLCKKGYVRANAQDKHCVVEHMPLSNEDTTPKGLIAGICIAVILALCAVVGFAVYRRWKIFPPRKPFWTVELKEDHDGVNFSAVPGQEYVQHDAADVQDLEFYEKHRGKSGGKSVSSYSQLKEDI